ncbi:MAG: DNA polymerase III subunit alpha [Chlamydiia bacterium]|nr:DNA polymerase III subunit alpha [Chlamydiia bacterium]
MTYSPLHLHSQYSILDATGSIKQIVKKGAEWGVKSMALTDSGNLYGAVEFYKACRGEGIKPIIGCEIQIAPSSHLEKKKVYGEPSGRPLTLLVKDQVGYRNLCKLVSIASIDGFYYTPRIDMELLKQHAEGLICLSGGFESKIFSLIVRDEIEEQVNYIKEMKGLFGDDFYLEVQRHEMASATIAAHGIDQESWLLQRCQDSAEKEKKVCQRLVELGKEHGIELVATNDIHYLEATDWKAHEILMNVQSGEPCEIWERDSFGNLRNLIPNPKRQVSWTHECYFKSIQEMEDLFSDLPGAVANTGVIADKCQFEMDFDSRYYPVYVPPAMEGTDYTEDERVKATEAYLVDLCEKGIAKKYTSERLEKVADVYPGKDPMEVVRDRLKYELAIIFEKGMGDYLLIVYDFINWAKEQYIPVGPGRGSGAGSIILYLIDVTNIEPLRFHLFFERFINPERPSYPDIDVDICMERRSEVIQYTLNKYGKDKVAQIITFGTMKAKMAIKDVGRVLNVPLSKVNAIAKLVPDDLNITLEKALDTDPDFRQMVDSDPDAKKVVDFARKVEGCIRNTGIHAAGIIVCGDVLTDHIPLCSAKDSEIAATQYSMKPVEQVGMLKIDFLGLKTLTSIQKAIESIEKKRGINIDWANLPLNDNKTFDLLNQGKTSGIFQLESGGMQELSRNLHIDRFEEIIAVTALYRPGPMDMIPSFISRKHGTEEITYDHEWLKSILQETYGIMVYQEQVMQLASTLAGYSLGEGDVLRRAMGKKDHEEMERQRAKFCDGAEEKSIDKKLAGTIFDKVQKFASYGFNKSHAAAYGYLSYVTAFLKSNYPSDWMAALMSCDITDLSKVAKHIREAQSMGIDVLPPDVNESEIRFIPSEKGIRFAMAAIKGVGDGVVEAIVQIREESGPYQSLYDFVKRIDTSKVGKRVIENLIQAGCFDFTGWTRKQSVIALEGMYDIVAKQKKESAKGFMDLFANANEDLSDFSTPPLVEEEPSKLDLLRVEKELLGFYVTGHPLDENRELINQLRCHELSKIESVEQGAVMKFAFIIETAVVRISQRTQRKFAILNISNGLDKYELPVWPELFESTSHLLSENQLIYAIILVEKKDQELKLSCKWMEDLTLMNEERACQAKVAYDMALKQLEADRERAERFPNRGGGKKSMQKEKKQQLVTIKLDSSKIQMSQVVELKEIFSSHLGNAGAVVEFYDGEKRVGKVDVDASTGIEYTSELKEKLAQFAGFIDSSVSEV